MNILGISAFYHDSAAALVRDGEIVAAAQEERFTRVKHDSQFPRNAVDYCLSEASLEADQLDVVAFYDKPLLKFDRILETYIACAPRGYRMFVKGLPLWLKQKLHTPRELDRGLDHRYRGRYVFLRHHESHAASAFFPSPFERAAILTLDGVGEWTTGSIGAGSANRIRLLKELRFPHSLGLLYSAFTYFCGFKVNSGEYKLMGLAPYGEPRYAQLIREKLIDLKSDGSFRMNMSYFAYCCADLMISKKFERLFGGPPRTPEGPLTQREMDLAASIQEVTEEIMLRAARHAHDLTGERDLVMAGGVALNCVGNGRILRDGPFDRLWIQPAAGDAGGALGAALFVWYQMLGRNRTALERGDSQKGSLLGPEYSKSFIQRFLDECGAVYHYYENEDALVREIARLVSLENVVGHMDGRMEFGPRALGNRSILGDPRSAKMQSTMNLKIKFRESFRPFAPSVLSSDAGEFFELCGDSPYMLLTAPLRIEKRLPLTDDGVTGLDRRNQVRSVIPAVTHVDCSARVQTVDPLRHPRFHRILERLKADTGCPVIINTSFNVRGEPIVCTPEDAYRCFLATDMDVLVLGSFLLYRHEQPRPRPESREAYLRQFQLD
jgi:carbamoyltransferase